MIVVAFLLPALIALLSAVAWATLREELSGAPVAAAPPAGGPPDPHSRLAWQPAPPEPGPTFSMGVGIAAVALTVPSGRTRRRAPVG